MIPPAHPFERYRRDQRPVLTQAKLGRMLGVSRSHINRIENGERQIGTDLLLRAVAETGLSPKVLRPDLQHLFRKRAKRVRRAKQAK